MPESQVQESSEPARWPAATLAVVLLLGAMIPAAQAATWSPALDLGSRLDGSHKPPFAAQDSLFATLQPQLGLLAGTGATRFQAFGRTLFGYRPAPALSPGQPRVLSYDRISDRASASLSSAWSDVDSVALGGRYLRSHDPLELGDWSALATSNVTQWGGWGRGSLWRAEGAYRIDDWSYSAVGLQDARSVSWSAFALPVRQRTDALLVGWREHELDFGSQTAVQARMALAGYRRTLAPWAVAQLEAGGADIHYSDGTHQRSAVFGLILGDAQAGPGSRTSGLHVWRDFATNVTAQVAHGLGDGSIALRWESVGDFEGGIFRNPTFVRRGAIDIQDTLARSTVVGLEASYGRTEPFHFIGPRADLGRISGWLERRVRPWLSVRGSAAYLTQSAVGADDVPTLRRLRVDVAVGAHGP